MASPILRGAAAGAAGTTALNAVTYLDMVLRGRPASSTPEQTVDRLARLVGVRVPGEGKQREARLSAIGALLGILTGTGVGAACGVARSLGWRPSVATGALVTGLVAMAGANVPIVALGVSDPRTWSVADWVSDIVPHLVFGIVTAATCAATSRPAEETP
jgi:hypothetical protein